MFLILLYRAVTPKYGHARVYMEKTLEQLYNIDKTYSYVIKQLRMPER